VKRAKNIPPPPPASASDAAKAAYYERYNPADLLDAGYLVLEGVFEGDECLVDLRAARGKIAIPIDARVARRVLRLARRSGCTPSDLASRCLAESLDAKSGH
jgi:hypothetical protein